MDTNISFKSVVQLPINEAKSTWDKIVDENNAVRPMFSFEWYQKWIEVHKGYWEPYILLIDNKTIAPLVRRNNLVQFAHAYTDFNDLIGPVEEAWPKIVDFLLQSGINRVELENITNTSATVTFFQSPNIENVHNLNISAAKTAPFITLPQTFEAYLATIKPKRRKYLKFKKDNPEVVTLKSTDPENDIGTLIELLKTNPIKLASLTPEKEAFFRGISSACKENIWIQLLRIGDRTISILYMFINKHTVMVYNSAFSKEEYTNAGTYLIIDTIKTAIEQKYTEFSLLIGREQYKYELGAIDFSLYSVSFDLGN